MLALIPLLGALCLSQTTDVQDLSLEEKVGQVLMVHFQGESANDSAKTLIQDLHIGSIIYYNWANGLTSPDQVRQLSVGLQQLTKENRLAIPLLIAVDQEGGCVARLRSGFTEFPGNGALGSSANPSLAEESAFIMGKEMVAVGINLNLAPVVDIDSNPQNRVIGNRSFGSTAEIVTTFGKSALTGFKKAGIATTLKHFPGHGDVSIDSHEGLPILHKSKEALQKEELLPFQKLAPFTDAIMTAHILVPEFDKENCATLSPKLLSYLRNEIGFQGVIISDSLIMEGVLKKCHSIEDAAIQALCAGCDLLILGGKLLNGEKKGFELSIADIKRIHLAIVTSVKKGALPESRLNAAVTNVLTLKKNQAFAGSLLTAKK